MKVIKEDISNKLEVNKSIFYTDLIKVYNKDDVIKKLDLIKSKYKDATHYCYAYIIDEYKKSSDDGEPGGTAGIPILDVLQTKELNYILCVVTRYFGGIKLGAGGLVRAYRKATVDAINKIQLLDILDGYEIKIDVSYNEQKDLEYLIKDNYQKDYGNTIIYTIRCDKEMKDILENRYQILSINKIKIER